MHELIETKESLPVDYVSMMEKVLRKWDFHIFLQQKEAARRQKMREEKIKQKAEEEKAKIQSAIERSTRQVTRMVKQLYFLFFSLLLDGKICYGSNLPPPKGR